MNIDPKSVKVSLHTGTPPTSPVQDVSWGSAEPVTVTVVHIGDEIFVRPDWDAYEMGRLAGVQAARDAVAALPHEDACCSKGCACRTWEWQEPCDLSCNCSFWWMPLALAAIDALVKS